MINYYLLMKPGILLGNLLTVVAGFLLASESGFDIKLFLATIIGLTGIMASACVLNNYIDRALDKKMERTKNRPLVLGLVSPNTALFLATILGVFGGFVLFAFTNFLTLMVAAIGFFVYVVPYSLWKCHTVYGTAIGSIAGAVPPVVGYCAVSNRFDTAAFLLFLMMVLWQMPHFYAIAMAHMDDYRNAKIPVLPLIKGEWITKLHMTLYIVCFIFVASLLTLFQYTGYAYLAVAITGGLIWLGLCLQGFISKNNQRWGKHMFQVSLVIIVSLCFVIVFEFFFSYSKKALLLLS